LLEIIAGYANKANNQAEKQGEQGRKYGDFHQASKAETADTSTPVVASTKPKRERSIPPENWRKKV